MGSVTGYEDLDFVEFTLNYVVLQWTWCRGCDKKLNLNSAVCRIVPNAEVEYFCQDCWEEFDVSLYPYHHGGLDA